MMILKRGVIGLAAAVLALVVGYSASYRARLGNWPWQGDPRRLSFCGHDYVATPQTDLGLLRSWDLDRPLFNPVFRTVPLIGQQVYSDLSPRLRARISRGGHGCGGLLMIKDSLTTVRVYRQ
jgi:hypothetical protein